MEFVLPVKTTIELTHTMMGCKLKETLPGQPYANHQPEVPRDQADTMRVRFEDMSRGGETQAAK